MNFCFWLTKQIKTPSDQVTQIQIKIYNLLSRSPAHVFATLSMIQQKYIKVTATLMIKVLELKGYVDDSIGQLTEINC